MLYACTCALHEIQDHTTGCRRSVLGLSERASGIPVLSRLPLIGGAFRSRSRADRNTELFIFLTPRIVRDDAGQDSLTGDVRRNAPRAGKLQRKALPVILPRPERGGNAPAAPTAAGAPRPVNP